jgi:hypothetical protein
LRVEHMPRHRDTCLTYGPDDIYRDANERLYRLQAVAARLFRGRTTLTIAHRLGAVIDCDTVVVLETGRLVASSPRWWTLRVRARRRRCAPRPPMRSPVPPWPEARDSWSHVSLTLMSRVTTGERRSGARFYCACEPPGGEVLAQHAPAHQALSHCRSRADAQRRSQFCTLSGRPHPLPAQLLCVFFASL